VLIIGVVEVATVIEEVNYFYEDERIQENDPVSVIEQRLFQ
jgi:hypothetical protein